MMHVTVTSFQAVVRSALLAGMIGAATLSCVSTPVESQNVALEEARAAYAAGESDPEIARIAPVELMRAREALYKAEDLWRSYAPREDVEHYAYLATQRLLIAREAVKLDQSEVAIREGTLERERLMIESKAREVDEALRQAEEAEGRARELQKQQELQRKIFELRAVNSERGMVITLGERSFDPGEAELKSGAQEVLARLSAFLRDYPQRTVMVEGFTDSMGSPDYNQDLSERRANAVRDALVQQGVGAVRVLVRGYGEAFPVAANTDPEGRSKNRRVEIIVSGDEGHIPERAY